jgi:hypothetical protein
MASRFATEIAVGNFAAVCKTVNAVDDEHIKTSLLPLKHCHDFPQMGRISSV